MRLDRLLQVANHLETVRDDRFDLTTWQVDTDCGTVACAIGHSVDIFYNDGLRLKRARITNIEDEEDSYKYEYIIAYHGLYGWAAIMYFFEISLDDALKLFSITTYYGDSSRKAVIAKIRQFILDQLTVDGTIKLKITGDSANEMRCLQQATK